jgi:DNA-directed RNA polymerase specialized sigma24 family protein
VGRTESWETEFIAFVVARSPALLRTAFLLTGDRGHAEDLVQTALAKTYAAWPRIRDVGAVEAYVRRTMLTTYMSWRRRRH